MPRVILLVVTVLACLTASPALADDDVRVRAEARWKQGKAFYDAGQWDRAIAEFRAVWEVTKEPDLLFSIGLAFHKKGDLEAALDHFKRYLDLAPSGDAANEAREMVVTLTPKVEALRAEAAHDAQRKQAELEAKRQADERAREERVRAAASAQRRASILRWVGVSGIVAGGALIGVGAKFGLDASKIADDLTEHTDGAWTEAELDRQADGRAANRKFIACTVAGGALVIGGFVTFTLSMRAQATANELKQIAWTPHPIDGGAGVSVFGRF